MAEKPTSKADDEEVIIGRITDLTSAFIRLIITVLKFFKIEVPKTAENAVGIILLLLFIYFSGGILELDLSVPMLTLYFIIIISILEIIAYNKPMISRIFSKHALAENIIKKITDGTITPDEASNEIYRVNFDADNIDKLIKELSKDNVFTVNIQRAIIGSQKLYIKNLKTYFGKDTNIKLNDEIVIDILKNQESYGALTEGEIRTIFDVYGKNDEIVAKLLLNQPLAKEILIDKISQSANLEYKAEEKYNENPHWLERYLNTISIVMKTVSVIIVSIILYFYLTYSSSYVENARVLGLIILVWFSWGFLMIINSNLDARLIAYAESQKRLTIQNYKENINHL